jgi:hypothetical protein
MSALSGVEGNPRSAPLFSCGSSVSVGSRVFAPRRASRVSPPRRSELANALTSRVLPYLHCALGSGDPDLAPLQRKRIHRRSEEDSSSARIRSCPSTSSGQSFAKRKLWRRGESDSLRSLIPRKLLILQSTRTIKIHTSKNCGHNLGTVTPLVNVARKYLRERPQLNRLGGQTRLELVCQILNI